MLSTILPVYNGERYLAAAIESVLGQETPPDELIVVDDGSTDGSAAVARSFGAAVRYHHQANANTGAARNTGVGLARGELLAFIDADDLWTPDKLALQLLALRDPTVEAVFGHAQQFISPELDADARARLHCPDAPQPSTLSTMMLIRREAFERIGPFETDLTLGADMSWSIRARDLGLRSVMLPQTLYRRRIHGGNKSIVHQADAGQRARVLREALARRRAASSSGPAGSSGLS